MAGASGTAVLFRPTAGLRGSVEVPADKSISHRAALIGAICEGPVTIGNYLQGADTLATLDAVAACGVEVETAASTITVHGVGLRGLKPPRGTIDVGNSGTTIRLMPGILAGQQGSFVLDGDASIRRRPMDRVVEPLGKMGVQIEARDGRYAPVKITGGEVRGISYEMPVASAQVKSALLLAGLYAGSRTEVIEPAVCRDHTEIMLAAAGARVEKDGLRTVIYPAGQLQIGRISIPGDFSSAAFLLVAAILAPDSVVTITGVGINPTRTGLLDILDEMGADIKRHNLRHDGGEPVADLTVRSSALRGVDVGGGISGRAIDELPLVALAGAFAEGETTVGGAAELKVKESDRITGLVENLAAIGVDIEAREDGFRVRDSGIEGGGFDSHGDHRMAMLGAVAGIASRSGVTVNGYDCVSVSYPGFLEALVSLGAEGVKD